MKITTKGRYAVLAMYDLAKHSNGQRIPLKEIAKRQDIPLPYLEKLIGNLRLAGLAVSIRGPYGGYSLAKSPRHITVGEIIRVTEGPFAPVDCILKNYRKNNKDNMCEKIDFCASRDIWQKVADSVNSVLDNITLADLCDED